MTKIKVTAQQRTNAIEARDVMWPSVPPENVYENLLHFGNGFGDVMPEKVDCKTVACFGGWCAIWPEFARQGMVVVRGIPCFGGHFGVDAAIGLFGAGIFAVRGRFQHDDRFQLGGWITDHELVTRRLNWLIENSEVVDG
jgi:hypothetical protein